MTRRRGYSRRHAAALALAVTSLGAAGAADAAPARAAQHRETVTDTYNTCDALGPAPSDVSLPPPKCEEHRVTYATRLIVIKRAGARGTLPVAQLQTDADAPVHLWIQVKAPPAEQRLVIWGMYCERSDPGGDRRHSRASNGRLTTTSSRRRKLPLRLAKPDGCSIDVAAGINQGHVLLTLFATVRGRKLSDVVIAERGRAFL